MSWASCNGSPVLESSEAIRFVRLVMFTCGLRSSGTMLTKVVSVDTARRTNGATALRAGVTENVPLLSEVVVPTISPLLSVTVIKAPLSAAPVATVPHRVTGKCRWRRQSQISSAAELACAAVAAGALAN